MLHLCVWLRVCIYVCMFSISSTEGGSIHPHFCSVPIGHVTKTCALLMYGPSAVVCAWLTGLFSYCTFSKESEKKGESTKAGKGGLGVKMESRRDTGKWVGAVNG